jgi:4-aminobutyrate aminotransferase / (S)-3-amino-2-methylpropionate transaminase / 5-aminovalerate transaminase
LTLTASAPSLRTRTRQLFEQEQRFIAPGLQTIALLSELAITEGRGVFVTDLDGNRYLDFNAGVSAASLGHSHPEYVAALKAQLDRVTVGSFVTPARAQLVELIADLAPGALRRSQFFSGGAEAVEAAIRLARSFTKRQAVVGFTGAFHGKTAGVLPLTDVSWKAAVGPLPPGLHVARYPDPADLERVIEEEAHGEIAAIIVEPIQGTAGNIIPPTGFLRAVKAIASRYGALLIADEMITGFGRTGRMFGCDLDGVEPDIMTTGKGMGGGFPISAVISTDTIVAAEPFSLPSASSSSFGGNPLAAAAALATIQTIVRDRLADNAARVGALMLDGLKALESRYAFIASARGCGLLLGFDLVADRAKGTFLPTKQCQRFFQLCLDEGLIVMSYNARVRIHPPLILTEDEARLGLAALDRGCHSLERELAPAMSERIGSPDAG